MLTDFRIRRHDETGRTDMVCAVHGNGEHIIVGATDPDNDTTSIVITKDEAIDLMAWLSEATK
jgi:hypothetical protein